MDVFKLQLAVLGFLLFGGNEANDHGDMEKRILLQDNYYDIVTELGALRKEIEALKKQTANRPATPMVFLAKLTKLVTGSGHHIYFDQIEINMGSAYNPHHGTFVAPVNGTYQFSLKACSEHGHYIVLDIMANDKRVERMIAGDSEYYTCSSTTLYTHLTIGDDVFVKQGPSGDYMSSSLGFGIPHFAGILLQAD